MTKKNNKPQVTYFVFRNRGTQRLLHICLWFFISFPLGNHSKIVSICFSSELTPSHGWLIVGVLLDLEKELSDWSSANDSSPIWGFCGKVPKVTPSEFNEECCIFEQKVIRITSNHIRFKSPTINGVSERHARRNYHVESFSIYLPIDIMATRRLIARRRGVSYVVNESAYRFVVKINAINMWQADQEGRTRE